MFSGRKDDKNKKPRRGGNLAQFGLMDVADLDNMTLGDDDGGDDDAALEAELLALTGGGGGKRKQPKSKAGVSPEKLAQMVNQCMRDDDDNDELSDEDDPDLLAELSALSHGGDDDDDDVMEAAPPPSRPTPERSDYRNPEPYTPRQAPMAAGESVLGVLAERRAIYEQAEAIAVAGGEMSRARRFNRGLKTIIQMEKTVKAGRSINENDIPPHVLVRGGGDYNSNATSPNAPSSSSGSTPPSEEGPPPYVPPPRQTTSPPASIPHDVVFPERERLPPQPAPRTSPDKQLPPRQASLRTAPLPPPSANSSDPTTIVLRLHEEYKAAALSAKKTGDKERAVQYLRTMKQMEPMLRAAKEGQPVDLASLPGHPGSGAMAASIPQPTHRQAPPVPASMETSPPANEPAAPPSEPAPPAPASILEALEQRLVKYTEQRDKAKSEENSRKERMNQRIMKQYEDAIKKHKAGKPVDYEDLPTPPGFGAIPVGGVSKPASTPSSTGSGGDSGVPAGGGGGGAAPPGPAVPRKQAPAPPLNVRQAPQSRVEKQLAFLTKRQSQFKQAALEAKKRGEMEQAKEYLRMSKGFDQLIEATRNGLPVDMNTVPVPPQEQMPSSTSMDFEVVSSEDCVTAPENTSADVAVTYTKLEEDLIAQIKMCATTREHFKATGDVASANRFEQLILHTKKDLDAVRAGFKRGTTPPRFHYESRTFSIIQCNTDLNDSDCEVVVVRGINFNVQNPKDVDTYVRIEFPYPSDNPPQDRSFVVKDTNNPEYNHKIIFSVDRKSRALARLFKRQSVKLQVYAKGGWFHRDTMLGFIKVPLVSLETKCTLHDSYDLMDDRKKMVGGKLEVKIRLRNPIVTKQLEKVTEKWLVIDGF